MGVIYKNGIPYGGAPNIAAAAGAHIDESGTPTVTATTSEGTTTFTFDYLKGDSSVLPADNITGSGTAGEIAKFDSSHELVSDTLSVNDISDFPESMPASDVSAWAKASTKPSYTASEVSAVSTTANQGLTTTQQENARDNIGLGSASTQNIPASGNASNDEVVLGSDTRLSDARQASDVYSWAKAETKPSYTASEVGAIATTAKGTANGVAELDANGLVPSAQLPSFVDDVLEYASSSQFPIAGEAGKIYVDTTTNITYRWSGTTYVAIGSDLALGETSSTAYRGDRGKTAYDHSQLTSGNPHNVTKTDVGLGNVGNFKAVSTETNQGLTSTEQENARTNIGAGAAATKGVVTTLDSSANLPTSAAVKTVTDIKVDIDDVDATPTTVTGNPITVNAANLPCENLSMTIEPIQSGSGTPSPENVRPISGLTEAKIITIGKNLFDKNNPNKRVNERVSTGNGGSYASSGNTVSYFLDVEPDTYYSLTTISGFTSYYYVYNKDGTGWGGAWPSGNWIQTAANSYSIRFDFPTANIDTVQFEKGKTSTAYESYQSNIATISFDGDTIYGGAVDFNTGIVTVTHGFYTLDGNETWTVENGKRVMSTSVANVKGAKNNTSIPNLISSQFNTITPEQTWYGTTGISVSPGGGLLVAYEDYTKDVNTWKSYLAQNPLQICYELATPTTLTLTPAQLTLLKGTNTVSANGASISLTYQKNNIIGDIKKWVKDYVDEQIAANITNVINAEY